MEEQSISIRILPIPNDEDLENKFQALMLALRDIQKNKISGYGFEALHRLVFTLVLHKRGLRLCSALFKLVLEHVEMTLLPQLLDNVDEDFLLNLQKTWFDYKFTTELFSQVLLYLDTMYIKGSILVSVRQMCFFCFRDLIIKNREIQIAICKNLLHLVDLERSGDKGNIHLAKDTIEIMHDTKAIEIYITFFESSYYTACATYFEQQSDIYLSSDNTNTFFLKTKLLVADEIQRAKNYLRSPVVTTIKVLIEKHVIRRALNKLMNMNGGIFCEIETLQYVALYNINETLKLVNTNDVNITGDIITSYIRKKCGSTFGMKQNLCQTPAYLSSLLFLREQLNQVTMCAFYNDELIYKLIDSEFKQQVNQVPKFAEHLAFLTHELLSRERTTKNDLRNVYAFYRYLSNKDVFQHYYEIHLARRLLMIDTYAEDLEMDVVNYLKSEIGSNYTQKAFDMLNDVISSKKINSEFQKFKMKNSIVEPVFELNVNVLTIANWPITEQTNAQVLPNELLEAFNIYQMFFCTMNQGRNLKLLTTLCTAQVNAAFYEESQHEIRTYILEVTIPQLMVLLFFNENNKLSCDEGTLGFDKKNMMKVLDSLLEGSDEQRLLQSIYEKDENDKTITFYVLNMKYTMQSEVRKFFTMESLEIGEAYQCKAVDEIPEYDRRFEISAAIVRTMKVHKTLEHHSLLQIVNNILRFRFYPSKKAIKIEIQKLINQEYMTRKENDRNVYQYCP